VCAPGAPAPSATPASAVNPKTCVPAPPARAAAGASGAASTPAPAAPASSDLDAAAADAAPPGAMAMDPAAGGWIADWFGIPALAAPAASTSETGATIPDFRGMGMAHALATARLARIAVTLSGSGRVVEQRPAPGPVRTERSRSIELLPDAPIQR